MSESRVPFTQTNFSNFYYFVTVRHPPRNSAMSWVQVTSESVPDSRVFRRPLGVSELGFYWDSVFHGTADTLAHIAVEATNPDDGRQIFSEENVRRTWRAMNARFPILGASLEELDGGERVDLVVCEAKLIDDLRDEEVTLGEVDSEDAVGRFVEGTMNGPRRLSNDIVSRIYVLRRTDRPTIYHLMFHAAHLITDAASNCSFIRTFLDILCLPAGEGAGASDSTLEERLGMIPCAEVLYGARFGSEAKRRWRRACGGVIYALRQSKLQGGHTLPRKSSSKPREVALDWANSQLVLVELPEDKSMKLINACRRHGVTFGHAFPILSQFGFARTLYKLYRSGKMSEEEWRDRCRQPTHTGGPINLKPYFPQDWLERGGASEILLAISFFSVVLPFMPSPNVASNSSLNDNFLADEDYARWLSKDRFWLRCALVKRQQLAQLRHPLFVEVAGSFGPKRVVGGKDTVMRFREKERGGTGAERKEERSGANAGPKERGHAKAGRGHITAHGGSSVGNLDKLIPHEYPLPQNHPLSSRFKHPRTTDKDTLVSALDQPSQTPSFPPSSPSSSPSHPLLKTQSYFVYLRCRPGELYLGASTFRGKMRMYSFFDGDSFERKVVEGWIGEVGRAAEVYGSGNAGV